MIGKNTQKHMLEQDNMFKIIIYSEDYEVQAPLPDDFGMTFGSEYSMPFDTSSMSAGWQKAFALGGVAQKVGMRMKKLYTNPEPTEISFDLEFNAYYSAADEVLKPVFFLSQMTLGSKIRFKDLEAGARRFIERLNSMAKGASNFLGTNIETGVDSSTIDQASTEQVQEYGDALLGLIDFIQTPKHVTVKFGNVMKWQRMFITSCAVQFSNVLDSNGFPMSARCSITVTPETYPTADDMQDAFSGALNFRRS